MPLGACFCALIWKKQRDEFLETTNANGVMTRPVWILMNKLRMYESAQCGNLSNSEWLENRVVNIPSSVILWRRLF